MQQDAQIQYKNYEVYRMIFTHKSSFITNNSSYTTWATSAHMYKQSFPAKRSVTENNYSYYL
jgi:hypothetical protein